MGGFFFASQGLKYFLSVLKNNKIWLERRSALAYKILVNPLIV